MHHDDNAAFHSSGEFLNAPSRLAIGRGGCVSPTFYRHRHSHECGNLEGGNLVIENFVGGNKCSNYDYN